MWMRFLQVVAISAIAILASAILAIATLAMSSQAAIASAPRGSIHVGQWCGGVYADEKNGAFAFCAATTAFESGFLLTFGQTKICGLSPFGAHQG
jgi:hypothetical protein